MSFVARQWHLTRGQVQHIMSVALRQLVQNPGLDANDVSFGDVLTSTISPGNLERLVSRLRWLSGEANRESADNWPETADNWPETFRVSDAAAPEMNAEETELMLSFAWSAVASST